MVKLHPVVCTWAVLVSFSICGSNAPTSAAVQTLGSVDCSTIIYDVADCISFVSKGSKEAKPTTSCCSGFKFVMKAEPKCICQAFESSVQLGIEMDIEKTKILPKACGVSSNPMNDCGKSMTPVAEPVASFAKPPKSRAPAPKKMAPAPVPIAKANAPSTPSPVSPPKNKTPAPAPLTVGTPSPSPKIKTPAPVPSTGEMSGPSPPKKKSPAPAPSITKTHASSPSISKAPAPSPNSGAYLLPATSGVAILVLIASAFFFSNVA